MENFGLNRHPITACQNDHHHVSSVKLLINFSPCIYFGPICIIRVNITSCNKF